MLNDSDSIIVVCPHCGSKSKQTIRNLKDTASFACSCGGTVHTDINEVIEFAAKQEPHTLSKLRLRAGPP